MKPLACLLVLACVVAARGKVLRKRKSNEFPPGFMFGAATASYQIEGAWNEDGKGENIFDRMYHTIPNITTDGSNGDVACDSYHKYMEDITLAKKMHANTYRISISWPRVLPNGGLDVVNQAGVDYYNNVIDELIANDIEPLVTMFHWDLPQKLQDIGGWPNPMLIDYFKDYAGFLYYTFGDRVKWWLTFNEPASIVAGYAGGYLIAPGINSSGVGEYMTIYTMLNAHAAAYRLYNEQFRARQGGKVGITINMSWYEPATNSTADKEATERKLQFNGGIYAHPIFSGRGDYPDVVKQRVDANSRAEGRSHSRLVHLTLDEVQYIRGTADFIGLNHYSSYPAADGVSGTNPSIERDTGAVTSYFSGTPQGASVWLQSVPWGFRKILNWISQEYPGFPIFVTENGWSDTGELVDDDRISYLTSYLAELLKAINEDGVDVIGYTAWSLLDNFEWGTGFTTRFGLHHVDFDDPERKRTTKKSARVLSDIYLKQELPLKYMS